MSRNNRHGVEHPAFSRNFGFWNEAEQEALANSKVSLAGAGGDGFELGHKLGMMGVGEIWIADLDNFEAENSNRVPGARKSTLDRNKAEVLAEELADLPANPKLRVFNEGVTQDNVEEFVRGADLVIDESDLLSPEVGTMIGREAIKHGVPELYMMNIGFAGVGTSFHPHKGMTFEQMIGVPEGMPLDEVADMEVDFSRVIPYIPRYGDLTTLVATQEGASLPSISVGVDIASGIGTTEAFLHLTSGVNNKRKSPTWAPRFRYMDAYEGKAGTIRYPRASYYLGVAAMAGRSLMGLNPKADYSQESRDRRAAMRKDAADSAEI